MSLQRYRKKAGKPVQAIQLQLDTQGFNYQKWGAQQTCKAGDWLVDNEGDIYTVDQQVFADTYQRIASATYIKVTPVWAIRAKQAGSVTTKEGRSHYQAGDYIVSNHENGDDAWCIQADKFAAMYQIDE